MAGKRKLTVAQKSQLKLHAALSEASRLIDAARSTLVIDASPLGQGGGKPCGKVRDAKKLIRDARGVLGGPNPGPEPWPDPGPGGGKPCFGLDKALDDLSLVQADMGGKPCGR